MSQSEAAALIGVGVGVAALGAVLGVSAGFGYSDTAECRELQQTQLSCVNGVEDSCRVLKQRTP